MPTQPYFAKDGQKVPGTTTVLSTSLGWSRGPLMAWAHRMGAEGRPLRETTQAAADIGTLAHAMAEAHIKGAPHEWPAGTTDDQRTKATSAFNAYLEWRDSSRIEVTHSEVALVSNQHRYGGTLDGLGSKDGAIVLIDFKTSNGTYAEHLIQLAAYHGLVEECMGQRCTRWHLLRFGKERGDFHWHSYEPIDEAWQAFLHLRALYDLKRPLEALA